MPDFDLDFVRGRFPAFSQPNLEGWAFFENAGGSYPAAATVRRLTDFYTRVKVQPHARYPASAEAGVLMDAGPASLAPWLGVPEDWVHVGPSTTQNAYVLAQAFRGLWKEGDAIVVTNQDHEANSGAWRRLAETGIEVREWKVDEAGRLDPAGLERLLDGKVRLAAFPHCSNIVAEVNPVAEICAKVRAAGAVSVVDGVSYAPHGLADVGGLGADVYLFSAYKTFGPHQGVMVVRPEVAEALPNQSHFFNESEPMKRLVPAGPDHAQVAALAGVAEYLEELDARHFGEGDAAARRARVHDLIRAREQALLAPLLAHLEGHNRLRLLGPADPAARAPTVAVALDLPGEVAAKALAERKIMAGGGHFYAWRLIEALGVDPEHGVLRLSFLHYTSEDEIARLIEALDALPRA